MLQTGAGDKNIFLQIKHIHIEYMKFQASGYFRLRGIINVNESLTRFVLAPALQNMAKTNQN